jgi:hypothetical protein
MFPPSGQWISSRSPLVTASARALSGKGMLLTVKFQDVQSIRE